MILCLISCLFSLALFLSTLILHSPPVRSSSEVVRSQVFTRFRVFTSFQSAERVLHSTVQVVDGKVKEIC